MEDEDDFAAGLLAKKAEEREREREREAEEASEDPEVTAMKQERSRLQDESLDASERALRLARQTELEGAKTTENLKKQGEQLKRTEALAKEADKHADDSHKSSKDLKKYDGWFAFRIPRFRKKSKKKDDEEYQKKQRALEEEKEHLEQSKAKRAVSSDKQGLLDDEDEDLVREANKENLGQEEKDKQYEENLDGIHSAVKNLKQMSLDMNEELEEQDVVIRSIDNTTAHTTETLEKTNKNIRKFV